jgi:fatty acid-binding protein DegV
MEEVLTATMEKEVPVELDKEVKKATKRILKLIDNRKNDCECGGFWSGYNKKKHEKSKRHVEFSQGSKKD